jgi:hypothetical protein
MTRLTKTIDFLASVDIFARRAKYTYTKMKNTVLPQAIAAFFMHAITKNDISHAQFLGLKSDIQALTQAT